MTRITTNTPRSTDPRRFQPMNLAGPVLCFFVGLALTVAGISGADLKLASDNTAPAESPVAAPEILAAPEITPPIGETVLLPVPDWDPGLWPQKLEKPALFRMKKDPECELAEVEEEEAIEELRLQLRRLPRIVIDPVEGA